MTTVALTTALAVLAACSSSDPVATDAEPGPTGGGNAATDAAAAVELTPVGDFEQVSDLKASRERFSVIRLSDGRLLAVGGKGRGFGNLITGNWNETAEVFDPETQEWTFTSPMGLRRRSPALVELPDGRVLAAGGLNPQKETIAVAEIWDPADGTWTRVSPLNRSRDLMGAVLLLDGRVMLVGGKTDSARLVTSLDESEIYDPETDEWTAAAPMGEKRINHATTLLSDGRVLVTGGGKADGPFSKTAQVYDPATDAWTTVASMSVSRAFHTATLLLDGRVLVVGGKGKRLVAEAYDPDSNSWSPAGSTGLPRSEHTAIRLPDGRVLVIGGIGSLDENEVFDPLSNSWSSGGAIQTGRYRHSEVLLPDGRILVMGGTGSDGILASVELLAALDKPSDEVIAAMMMRPTPGPEGVSDAVSLGDSSSAPEPTPTRPPRTGSGQEVLDIEFADPVEAEPGPTTNHVDLGTPVRVGLGQKINSPKGTAGLVVEYLALEEDTRCPAGQECDEPGRVVIRIMLRVAGSEGPLGDSLMVIERDQEGTTVKAFGRYSVGFLALDPVPDPDDTTATLVIFEGER